MAVFVPFRRRWLHTGPSVRLRVAADYTSAFPKPCSGILVRVHHTSPHTQSRLVLHPCPCRVPHSYASMGVTRGWANMPTSSVLGDTVPTRTRTWTRRPSATLHRTLPYHTKPKACPLAVNNVARLDALRLAQSSADVLATTCSGGHTKASPTAFGE